MKRDADSSAWHRMISTISVAQRGTAFTGSGLMQENGRSETVPVTASGSYTPPRAALTIRGMQFEGGAVTGLLHATNGARIMADTLVFAGERYERKMIVFLSGP